MAIDGVDGSGRPAETADGVIGALMNRARQENTVLAMLGAGILPPPYVITDNRMCVAFTDDDIDETVAAAHRAFAAVA